MYKENLTQTQQQQSLVGTQMIKTRMLEPLAPREPFPSNYQHATIDRNALYALNTVMDRNAIAAVRTKMHRSRLNFEDLKANLLEYDKPRPPRQHEPSYYAAFESVRRDLNLKPQSIVPITTGAVAKHPDLPGSKSPGLPYKLRGYNNKRAAVDDPAVLQEIRKLWYLIESGADVELADVSCYARSHIAVREKNKIRAVWGYPLEVYMAEAAYFYPLLEAFKEQAQPLVAYGVEIGNGGMTYIHSMVDAFPTCPVLLGDWTGFDHTVPAWLIRDSFRILAEAIDWSHVRDAEGKIWKVRPTRSKRRWRKLVNYFIDTPVRLSDGTRYMKHCGVPSGSCFTNVIDSIVNALVMRYLVYELTGSFPRSDIYLGDDSVVVLPTLLNLDVFADIAQEQFGMVFNVEKSSQVYDRSLVHFLGYYNNSGTPYKPIDSIVASTIYPERSVYDKVDTISRLIGQAYSCFDPHQATLFVKAANLLIDEENLSEEDIDAFIRSNPHRFKYLSTLGIDPTSLGIPSIRNGVVTWRTLPTSNRRKWKFKPYIPEELYLAGLISYGQLELEY